MNDFVKRIEYNIKKRNRESGLKVFENITFMLTKKTSLSLSDVMSAPTPLILSMNKELIAYYEKKNKAMKKKR